MEEAQMKKQIRPFILWSALGFIIILMAFLLAAIFHSGLKENGRSAEKDENVSESWMGIYMDGIKVGHSHSQEEVFIKKGKKYQSNRNEAWMRISRLGGNPVEMQTIEESLHDAQGRPLEALIRTKISDAETVIRAEIKPDRVMFKAGEKLVKELPYREEFYLGVPLKKIMREEGMKPGRSYDFKILDPVSYSFGDCHFEIIGREDVLILGKKMNLWHVKSEALYVIPITTEEWVDEEGIIWKSISQTSFIITTSIRMSREKALEVSEENFDIAFSTVIRSNITFAHPQEIQSVTFKLSGIPIDRIKSFPYDDGSQKIIEVSNDHVILQTTSQIFYKEEALSLPIEGEGLQEFLRPTLFCQSDDPEIKETAYRIVGRERNSWKAAKKIAEWVSREMTPNYDVGFATAKEILKNREGDCSEHTVITVALCRAVGIPARAALGIMHAGGLFAYHMWPEVYVGRWIGLDSKWLAIDAESGEPYTDATHIKFGRSSLDENIFKEMAQAVSEIIGRLKLEILDYR